MSLYIPPECKEFIRVCSTEEVCWGYFIGGVVLSMIIMLIIWAVKDYIKKKKGTIT